MLLYSHTKREEEKMKVYALATVICFAGFAISQACEVAGVVVAGIGLVMLGTAEVMEEL